MNEIADIRKRVAQACRVIGLLDLTPGTLGHVSARLPGTDRIFIRARGPAESGVRYTAEDDILEIGLDGKRIDGKSDGYSAPLEVHIHTEIYKSRPEVNAVTHIHPSIVVLLTICNKPLLPIYGAYDPQSLRLVLDGVPIYERSILIEKPDLGRELVSVMGNKNVCLMQGHGITTAANSVEEATLYAIHLNDIATMNYRAYSLGGITTIPQEEQDAFHKMKIDTGYGDPVVGVPSGRAANLWRYYTRLAEDKAGG